jgi:outer membrane protein assembly factor BamE (lipoprotein component of BamABCDE complex)
MYKYTTIIIIVLISVFLASCASSIQGTKVDSAQVNQIQKGKTTETEVIRMFGKPDEVTTTGNQRILLYTYMKTSGSVGFKGIVIFILTLGIYPPSVNATTESNSLNVTIENGLVRDFTYSEGSQKSKL